MREMNDNTKMELTIIILTYNSAHIIKSCLDRINLDRYKVIVVDNASSDETLEVINNNFKKIQLVKLGKNVGYGNGNNVGLELVDTEFALILNPDAIIEDKDIDSVLLAMQNKEEVALAGPLMLKQYPFAQKELENKLNEIEGDLATIQDNCYQKIDNILYVRFIVGAALFVRMSVFKKIGFFDKKIFLFYEDNELCRRALSSGYKNIIVLTSHVFHVEAGSTAKTVRNLYRRSWHLKGWSKLYWKKILKSEMSAKRSAVRMVMSYFVRTIYFIFLFKPDKIVCNLGACCGAFSFLIGLQSFDKDGNPRG